MRPFLRRTAGKDKRKAILGARTPFTGLSSETIRLREERRKRVLRWFCLLVVLLLLSWAALSQLLPLISHTHEICISPDTMPAADICISFPTVVWPGLNFEVAIYAIRKDSKLKKLNVEVLEPSFSLVAKNTPWHHVFNFEQGNREDWLLSLMMNPGRHAAMSEALLTVKLSDENGNLIESTQVQIHQWPFFLVLKTVVTIVGAVILFLIGYLANWALTKLIVVLDKTVVSADQDATETDSNGRLH